MSRPSLTDLASLPPTLPLYSRTGGPDVAGILGIGKTIYDLAARGELPVTPLRLGRRIVVPTAALLAALGVGPANNEAPE